MRKLCTVVADMVHFRGNVEVVQWCRGDPFPDIGPSVGIDTETELITDTCLAPSLVVLGVFDSANNVCYISQWEDAPEFMRQLNSLDVEQRYFNIGFDEQVLDNEDPEKTLLTALDQGRVRDMQVRVLLNEIATLGFIRQKLYSLQGCTLEFENWMLDKGDGTEDSTRLSFKRQNADGSSFQISEEQAKYLALDCISTWAVGEAVPPSPVEVAHTLGLVVLAHISSNGFPVDRLVRDYFERKIVEKMDARRAELISFGFPDPYHSAKKEAEDIRTWFHRAYASLLQSQGLDSGFRPVAVTQSSEDEDDDEESPTQELPMPAKTQLRLAVMYLYAHEQEPTEVHQLAENLKVVVEDDRKILRKEEKALWDKLCEDYGLASVDTLRSATAIQAYVAQLFESTLKAIQQEGTYTFKSVVEAADDYLDSHPTLTAVTKPVGPKKFFQEHIKELLRRNPGLVLETTKKSKEIQLTLKDLWRLEDCGVSDAFLTTYTDYKHCEKYKSTYLKPEFVKADGRVHAKFTNLVRTGRTSCNTPNIQQLPSRDVEFPLKLMYRAPEGAILCATDFSFIESSPMHGSLAA